MPRHSKTDRLLDAAARACRDGDLPAAQRFLREITWCGTPEQVARYARGCRMVFGPPPEYPPDGVREPGPWMAPDD